MKYILKNQDEKTNEIKPYILRFNEDLLNPLADLTSFEKGANEPILLSNFQKDMLNSFGRTFWITCYYAPSVIRYILANIDGLSHFAFCTHDKDTTKENELKKIHTHLLLYFNERVSASFVAFWFHSLEIKIISRTDLSNEWNYLIHDSKQCRKDRKYLYDDCERITDNKEYWLGRCVAQVNENQKYVDMFQAILQNKNRAWLVAHFGREYIYLYRNLKEIAQDYYNDNIQFLYNQTGDIVGKVDDKGVFNDYD